MFVQKLLNGLRGASVNSLPSYNLFVSRNDGMPIKVCVGRPYGAEMALTDYDSVLKLDLGLVDVFTPTPTHAHLSILALEAGHNVLVENPMAVSLRECDSMVAAAKRSGRTPCVVHNKRFFNSIVRTKSVIERERLRVCRMRLTHLFTHAHPAFRPSWILNEAVGGFFGRVWFIMSMLRSIFLGRSTPSTPRPTGEGGMFTTRLRSFCRGRGGRPFVRIIGIQKKPSWRPR